MPKALLLPSYLGGGFGHISRCLALAEELCSRGWEAAFAFAGKHAVRVERQGYPVYRLRQPYLPGSKKPAGAAYIAFADFSHQLVRDGLHSQAIIRASLAEQLRVVRQSRPDVLIADSWPLASILAYLTGLPLVQIIRSINHPVGPGLIWWKERPSDLVSPDARPVFNPLLQSMGMSPISKGEDLLAGDLYLVPGVPELDPLPESVNDTQYVGPLSRSSKDAETVPDWLQELDRTQPVIFVTMGGGADLVGGLQFYAMLLEALSGLNQQVVISTGARVAPQDLPVPPDNIHIESWVPGARVIERSDLVVYPGGYGTTMELVRFGKPGLAIPFHSEQESNARRLEAAGMADVLLPAHCEPQMVWGRWPGGKYSTLFCPKSDLTPDAVYERITQVLTQRTYQANAMRLQKASEQYGGAAQAANLIEHLLESTSLPSKNGWDRLNWWGKLAISLPFRIPGV